MNPAAGFADGPRPDPANVGAVFVTYHPDAGLGARVQALAGQVREILIVDNGSTDDERVPIRILEATGNVTTIFNPDNVGLAAALNQGLAWGEQHGLSWMVTFDQDTTPGPNLVAEAGRVFEAHQTRPAAVIGAGWVSSPGRTQACVAPEGIEVTHVITSGALHSVPVWRSLGGFRGDFFIDYVDTEYCLRARAAGYLIAQACIPTMSHAIGQPTRRWMLFRSVTPSNHPQMRRYYITRNRIQVWRAYWLGEPGYVAYDMKAAAKELVKLVFFEADRKAKIRALATGIRDGIGLSRARK